MIKKTFTFYFQDGITYRGCSTNDLNGSTSINCENGSECVQCAADKCNGITKDLSLQYSQQKIHGNWCYECDSVYDPKCVAQIDDSMKKQCPNTKESLGCYHTIEPNLNGMQCKQMEI